MGKAHSAVAEVFEPIPCGTADIGIILAEDVDVVSVTFFADIVVAEGFESKPRRTADIWKVVTEGVHVVPVQSVAGLVIGKIGRASRPR